MAFDGASNVNREAGAEDRHFPGEKGNPIDGSKDERLFQYSCFMKQRHPARRFVGGPLSTLNGGSVILAATAAVDPKPTCARTFKGRPDVKSTIIVPNEATIIS